MAPRGRRTPAPEPRPQGLPQPLRAVIDTNVFAHQAWLRPLLAAARDGFLVLFWSPCIISETTRLLTWHWLRRAGSDLSDDRWTACSVAAKTWFSYMTAGFHVVEDRPPLEGAWTADPPDQWDIPIWTAAVRAGAAFVVTENLKDGPPEGPDGRREYQGVLYIHPEQFLDYLDRYVDALLTEHVPAFE